MSGTISAEENFHSNPENFFSNIHLEFTPVPENYAPRNYSASRHICIPASNQSLLLGSCSLEQSPLEQSLRVQINSDNNYFFTLPFTMRLSMLTMGVLKAFENYQKVMCKSGHCCSSKANTQTIKKTFIAVYLAMGLSHFLEEQITSTVDVITGYSYEMFHFMMLAGSLVARAVDCDCKHPWLNKHVGMVALNVFSLLNPYSLFH
ncbi:hypothetical protein [Endozoicomonas sp. OPT23]|uniref:hypothetical protein n=1 Tax=Endozoicomonas sp. OPT23 TaxID=2072845 RepID=UPI001890C610|nr:hypothetical protein [Endozoicomonas sp. OPT23]